MSFHFPRVFPLISDHDRSVWHNGKHPYNPVQVHCNAILMSVLCNVSECNSSCNENANFVLL